MEIEQILEERGTRYGEFTGVSLVAQNIKAAMRHSANWAKLPADAREGLEMVANKVARILNGGLPVCGFVARCRGVSEAGG